MANQITTTIKEIVKTKEWDGKFGKMYAITLHCENGEYPILNKTKADAFKVGDTVTYEVVEPGKKWKEVTEKSKKSGSYQQSQEGYFTSIAFQIGFQGFNPLDDNENFQARVLASRRIFSEMMDNFSNPDKKENDNTDKNTESPKADEKDDDLPF